MVRSRLVLLSAIFATLVVALAVVRPPSPAVTTPAAIRTESTATIAASGVYGRGYRVSMLVHLNRCIPRPRIGRSETPARKK